MTKSHKRRSKQDSEAVSDRAMLESAIKPQKDVPVADKQPGAADLDSEWILLPATHQVPKEITIEEHVAVTKFREYLRIKTVHPTPDYETCTLFLKEYAHLLSLQFKCIELVHGKPIIIMTLPGAFPNLKSVMLNSHTDVVPVSEAEWKYPAFSATKLPNGDIFARGAQDMKCVGIWYLEALRKLAGKKMKRTIHVVFVPDEEIGGSDGMKLFCQSKEFRDLNVGFALDEGLANDGDAFKVYYGERAPWWMRLVSHGGAGHGSKFIQPSATIRLIKVLNKFIQFRDSEEERLSFGIDEAGAALKLGDVTTTNITLLNAGVQFNVVHERAEAGVDMRVSPLVDQQVLKDTLLGWCQAEEVSLEFVQLFWGNGLTKLEECKEWQVIQSVAKENGLKLETEIFPAATDSRFLRQIGINAIGISPIKNTPVLLHDHNEYLNEKTLIEGIDFYVNVIFGIANID